MNKKIKNLQGAYSYNDEPGNRSSTSDKPSSEKVKEPWFGS